MTGLILKDLYTMKKTLIYLVAPTLGRSAAACQVLGSKLIKSK